MRKDGPVSEKTCFNEYIIEYGGAFLDSGTRKRPPFAATEKEFKKVFDKDKKR